jgi:resuscitation-promoting factor RpfB
VLRSVKYGLHGAVLAGLISLPALWNSVDKTVDLVVDGHAQSIRTTADRVGEVLVDAGYRVTSHDLVAPASTSHIDNGGRIVLRRGRLLHLDVDGVRTDVWTTAPTVADALEQLGYSSRDFVSVSRERRLPLAPTAIAIRTPRAITIVHDGVRQQVTTTDPSVGDVLGDLGITLSSRDRLSVSMDSPVRAGETVRVQRVSKRLVSKIKRLPFKTIRHRDSSMRLGTTELVRHGKYGRARMTYSLVYVDGQLAGRTLIKTITLAKPKAQVLAVGTAKRRSGSASSTSSTAPSVRVPSPGTAKAIARDLAAARGWGDEQYNCLVVLWDNESGWNVHAANPSGAYGIPQALPGWKMSSAGPDWQNNATTQINWGLGYIAERYSTPCGAWSFWQGNGWY